MSHDPRDFPARPRKRGDFFRRPALRDLPEDCCVTPEWDDVTYPLPRRVEYVSCEGV